MPSLLDDPAIRIAFSVYENRGVYALLLGSGLSRAAGIPTGWEITVDLIRRVGDLRGEADQADWVSWYRETIGEDPEYSSVMGELGLSREERRSILQSYIEPTDEDRREGRKLPTAAHFAIADLVRAGYVRVIITTNFDRLIENALQQQGIEPTVAASEDALKGATPLAHTDCFLLKLHGDYKDPRILNTDAELSEYSSDINALLDRIFDEHGLVVCGWSGEWDHALRSAILRSAARRYSMFWAAHSRPGERAAKLIAHRDAQLVSITDADAFFGKLGEYVQTLERTHRPSPQSIELLVNNTKRYLAKPESRIQLDELVSTEAESLVIKLDSPDFSAGNGFSADEFRRRVGSYEAATEPLARVFGVLGRWGDGSEYREVIDVLGSIYSRIDQSRGGYTVWINLHSYPAVLLVTAYGTGLVRSQRWDVLHRLLTEKLVSNNEEEPHRIVEKLFLWSWKGSDDSAWKNLDGLEKRQTPLSDHLCDLFAEWSESYIGLVPSFEQLYETWEMMGSLAFSECYTVEQINKSMSNHSQPGYAWVPVGRYGWHNETRRRILGFVQQDKVKSQLVRAGFGNGHPELFDAAINNILRIVGRMGFGF